MIVNFYKEPLGRMLSGEHLISKNIESIPGKDTFIIIGAKTYRVSRIYFDVDICEYSIYLIEVS